MKWICSLLVLLVAGCGEPDEVIEEPTPVDTPVSICDSNSQGSSSELNWKQIGPEYFSKYQASIEATAAGNESQGLTIRKLSVPARPAAFDESTQLTTGWTSGVLACDGHIYSSPLRLGDIVKIDTTTGTVSVLPQNVHAGWLAYDTDLASDEKLYSFPLYDLEFIGGILRFNPKTGESELLAANKGINGYNGAVVAPNGMLYAFPAFADHILEFSPSDASWRKIYGLTTFSEGQDPMMPLWSRPVLAANGKIYAFPIYATSILEFDPETDAIVEFGAFGEGDEARWGHPALLPTGIIVAPPLVGTTILSLNPDTREAVEVPGSGFAPYWRSLTLAPDGWMYSNPASLEYKSLLRLNSTGETSIIETPESEDLRFDDVVLGANGKLYAMPLSSAHSVELSILEIDIGVENAFDPNVALSPYWNH